LPSPAGARSWLPVEPMSSVSHRPRPSLDRLWHLSMDHG
jgi:hypothetical protein